MSNKPKKQDEDQELRSGLSAYVQPGILVVLAKGPSYGYELSQSLREVGINFDGSTLYKQLRLLEKEGFVESHWHTEGRGPAKRFYTLTQEGADLLQTWLVTVEEEKKALEKLIRKYKDVLSQCGNGSCGCGCGKSVKLEFVKSKA